MSDLLRKQVVSSANLIVVKVGTRVLTHSDGTLDTEQIARLAEQLSDVAQTGRRIVLISSGAVGAGISLLGLESRPADLARLQAVAAVGQTHLIECYDRTFRNHGHRAAQVLLTVGDFDDRVRYLNVRNTLLSLLEFGAIPVINENDTVAVDELMASFGDNDRLAALVTNLLRAPLLIILSDVDGLYDGDPALPGSRLVSTVSQCDERVFAWVRDQATGISKGGMASKLEAARMATMAGENVVIAGGRREHVLRDVVAGKDVGTLLMAQGKAVSSRKRWIGFSAVPAGMLVLDDGACRAIARDGRSLLAIGILRCEGEFGKGDLVTLCDQNTREVARGLTNYSSADILRLQGLKSDKIAQVLGHRPYDEVIHRDNMMVQDR